MRAVPAWAVWNGPAAQAERGPRPGNTPTAYHVAVGFRCSGYIMRGERAGMAADDRPSRQGAIERVRGMADVLPARLGSRERVTAALHEHFGRHGYQRLDTPVVEATELFLRKSGEERAAQMYAFTYRNRQIALRPEFTASIVRAYLAELQAEPLPLRLAYSGPVFRYEKPQTGRYRQYTEAGVELLGAAGSVADAEVIHLALSGLDAIGLTQCRLRIGHLGIVGAFLASLPLDERVRDWFLWSMERLRTRGDAGLHRNLRALLARQQGGSESDATSGDEPPYLDDVALEGLDDGQIRGLVLALLRGAGVELDGSNRSPEEIVERLLTKLSRPSVRFDVDTALAFLRRVVALHGEPPTVLAGLRALLNDFDLGDAPLRELTEVIELLRIYGHTERITLDMGLGRGLHYYTGILFEVYDGDDDRLQLCGGGRYDDLAQVLGAREPVAASGFAYGVERLVAAIEARASSAAEIPRADLLVCGTGKAAMADLIPLAQVLRAAGWRVELDIKRRGLATNLRQAARAGIPIVAIVGDEELHAGTVTWRDMAGRTETRLALSDWLARHARAASRGARLASAAVGDEPNDAVDGTTSRAARWLRSRAMKGESE